jgi:hypothetical protein
MSAKMFRISQPFRLAVVLNIFHLLSQLPFLLFSSLPCALGRQINGMDYKSSLAHFQLGLESIKDG